MASSIMFTKEYNGRKTSVNTNELGMREMQARVYEQRNSSHLLVKAPPASGKSRALMFVALDKLYNQGIKKVIISVPERSIGKSFRSTKLKEHGYYWDWDVPDTHNLTLLSGPDMSKVEILKAFMRSTLPEDRIIIVTHATFRYACLDSMARESSPKLEAREFDDCLVAIDEFHHVSRDESSVLGEVLRDILHQSSAHVFAMTGSYFRGDTKPILDAEEEEKFDKVTYTYYEQLEGYKYLKSFTMAYKFYTGKYIDALEDVLPEFLHRKTIIHIPNVNSGESTGDKYDEVNQIIDRLGSVIHTDEDTGIMTIKANDGGILKVADLVTEDGRERVVEYINQMEKLEDLDIIIALGMAKEGFDWPYAEYALTIGYRKSLTEVVQIIGRVTRDSKNKNTAQFTNLIAAPDANQEEVQYAVNTVMKAIAASLLMENVLSPAYEFKPKEPGSKTVTPDDSGTKTIFVKGLKKPTTLRAKAIIEREIDEIKTGIINDPKVQAAIFAKASRQLMNKQIIPAVVAKMHPELSDDEIQTITQYAQLSLALGGGNVDPDNNKILKLAGRFVDIENVNIDLLDKVNPFQQAYEMLSRDMDSETLRIIARVFDAKKREFTKEEVCYLYPQLKAFLAEHGRKPERNPHDEEEDTLYYLRCYLLRLKREQAAANEEE